MYVAFAKWHIPRIRKTELTTRSPFITALAVACRDIDVRNVKALIMGPHETPYEFGFFEVCHERWMYPCLCKDGLIQLDSLPFGSTKVEPPRTMTKLSLILDDRISFQIPECNLYHHKWGTLSLQPQCLQQRESLSVSN